MKIFFNNNTESEYASFGTYLSLLFHIVAFDIKALVPWQQFVYSFMMWPPNYSTNILQVFIICEAFTSKMLLNFWKHEKVRRCQVRTVRRMLEDDPMELRTQRGLCLPGSTQTCIFVNQNNSTRELASSAR